MMNPTDSFESKKGAGLVKPHVTSIEGRVEFTTTTAALINPNVGAQVVTEGLPPVGAQTAACKSQCDVVTSSVHPNVLPSRTGGAPLPHNPPPQKPPVCVLSDSEMQRRLLEFIQQRTVHDLTFKSSSIERVQHVARLANASYLVSTVMAKAVTTTVSPALADPSGDPQARSILTQRFLCQIRKPMANVRENPHSLFNMEPIAMMRKNLPFARTPLLRLKEGELYSDHIFVRTIHFPLQENAVDEVKDIDPVKPLLEVTRILQRVGPTAPRGVVANQHLILGQSNDTLVLPMSMPVRDLSPNTVVGISGAFNPVHFDCGSLHWGKNGLSGGRTGTVLLDLDKLQMTDPTDSFGSKKGAGFVKPHVTYVKACVGRGSP